MATDRLTDAATKRLKNAEAALAAEQRKTAALEEALLSRMQHVEPCPLHDGPNAGCAACEHDLFLARLIDALTTDRLDRGTADRLRAEAEAMREVEAAARAIADGDAAHECTHPQCGRCRIQRAFARLDAARAGKP